MKSRYDYMTAGIVADTDNDVYPDVYSVNFSNYSLSQIPSYHLVNIADLYKPWTMMYKEYGITYFDDLYLNMNGIPYVGMLEPRSVLVNFIMSDIESFNSNKDKK